MAKLVQVRDEVVTGDSFYISINDEQFNFLKWLEGNEYLTDGVYFEEKDKVDDIIDLT